MRRPCSRRLTAYRRSRPPPLARRGTNCLGVRRSVLTLGGNRHWAHEVEVVVGLIWRLVAQPLLFGIIGSLLGFANLDVGTLPLSLGLVVCGACGRLALRRLC